MSGTGVAGLAYDGRSPDASQRADANQPSPWSADVKAESGAPASVLPAAAARTATVTAPAPANAALNLNLPGLSRTSAWGAGGPQQPAGAIDPVAAANPARPVDPALGGQSPGTGQSHAALAQTPLSRPMTDALAAAGYNSRGSSSGPGTVVTDADARSQPGAAQLAPDPAGLSGRSDPQSSASPPALPGGEATTAGGAQPSVSASLGPTLSGTSFSQGNGGPGAMAAAAEPRSQPGPAQVAPDVAGLSATRDPQTSTAPPALPGGPGATTGGAEPSVSASPEAPLSGANYSQGSGGPGAVAAAPDAQSPPGPAQATTDVTGLSGRPDPQSSSAAPPAAAGEPAATTGGPQPGISASPEPTLPGSSFSQTSSGPGAMAAVPDAQSQPEPAQVTTDLEGLAGLTGRTAPPSSSGPPALPGGPATTPGDALPGASASLEPTLSAAGPQSNAPAGNLPDGGPQTPQQLFAGTAPGPSQAAGPAAGDGGSTAALASLGSFGRSDGVGIPQVGAGSGRSAPIMPTSLEPVFGVTGASFTVSPGTFAAETTMPPGQASEDGAFFAQAINAPNASTAPDPTLDPAAVAALSLAFISAPTKSNPPSSASDAAVGRLGSTGAMDSVTAVAAIPGSLASDRPVPGQTAPANSGPPVESSLGTLPPGAPSAQTSPPPGLATNPGTADLASPMAARPDIPAAVPPGTWAYGFGPRPRATPQALLTPGIATSTNGRGRRPPEGGMIAYAEQRPVLLDLSPVEPEVPSWRLDDTQTLVSVGAGGVTTARARAVALYAALMDQGKGLAALQPGEGFATWDGSPLWLSLAGIAKPGHQGVLPNIAVPGRVQVQRAATGEWLVEHIGHACPVPRPTRHEATSVDDDSLSSDVLYGVTGWHDSNERTRRFEHALSALRFASGLAPPARWRSAEAWAAVARLCAASAMQVRDALTPPVEAALQAALSVVVSGLAPSPPKDALSMPPLSRERFLKLALSGDREQIVAALKGLGRAVLDRLRRGAVDDLDRLDTLALAVCLGRLARTVPPSASDWAASSGHGAGPAARAVTAGTR